MALISPKIQKSLYVFPGTLEASFMWNNSPNDSRVLSANNLSTKTNCDHDQLMHFIGF